MYSLKKEYRGKSTKTAASPFVIDDLFLDRPNAEVLINGNKELQKYFYKKPKKIKPNGDEQASIASA